MPVSLACVQELGIRSKNFKTKCATKWQYISTNKFSFLKGQKKGTAVGTIELRSLMTLQRNGSNEKKKTIVINNFSFSKTYHKFGYLVVETKNG